VVFPEIKPLRDLEQPPPHAFHVWDHIQQVMSRLDEILDLVRGDSSPDGAKDLQSGLVAQKLGRYRQRFTKQLAEEFVRERSRWALLFFAALFHDVGKANTQSRDENGRIHFYDHEKVGAQIFIQRARALRLSNEETSLLETIVRHHGRPYMLTKAGGSPSRRVIYRFFKDTGSSGVEICLLSLADFMGKFDAQVPQDELTRHLDTLRTLLEAYFEHAEEQVSPPALVNGDDLISLLDMNPGPKMGELLEAIREAQAAGDVMDKQAAIDFARNYLAKQAG
jgi:putative nucleotidyltransferase with HDIG domain